MGVMRIDRTLGRISLRMASKLDLAELLSEITRGLVQDLDAALARIWLVGPGDLCATCGMASRCRDKTTCLHLVASAGLSERLDGSYQRVPLGTLKIGRIAESREPILTNDLLGDPRVLDKEWVRREHLRSFAGYPLDFARESFGVLAMFARRELRGEEFEQLGVFAAQAAVAIKNARLFEEVSQLRDQLYRENLALREEVDRASMFEEIIGASGSLKSVLARIAKVAPTDSTVFISGETGTGKELFARAVHKRSQRSTRAFVSMNCAALPPSLISSELFGHEKGAFTGATQRRLGRFELANGGTIFLDEVGELLPDTQAALLRVLQEREFDRVGRVQPIQVDVRVIAATNRDLNAAVASGAFRQDLYYRLNVFPIEVPPLRERKEDILMLVEYFVRRYASRAGKNIRSIDKKTLDLLVSYEWPGNIRELQNVVERSVILSPGEVFAVDELWLSRESSQPAAGARPPVSSTREARSEREIIEAALAESRGRVSGPSGAAAKLQIPPSTLEYRIRALKIRKREFRFR